VTLALLDKRVTNEFDVLKKLEIEGFMQQARPLGG